MIRFIAESAIVTGAIQYIANKENWEDELIAKVNEKHRVFMIEGYGLIILADSGLQVGGIGNFECRRLINWK